MAGIEIDPLDATGSILGGLPEGPARDHIERQLQAPSTRSDLLDLITAQAHLNTSLAAAVVALWQKNDKKEVDAIGTLLDILQKNADLVRTKTTKFMLPAGTPVGDHRDG